MSLLKDYQREVEKLDAVFCIDQAMLATKEIVEGAYPERQVILLQQVNDWLFRAKTLLIMNPMSHFEPGSGSPAAVLYHETGEVQKHAQIPATLQ